MNVIESHCVLQGERRSNATSSNLLAPCQCEHNLHTTDTERHTHTQETDVKSLIISLLINRMFPVLFRTFPELDRK